MLQFGGKRELDQSFKQIEDVRNQIAHGDSVVAHRSSSIHTVCTQRTDRLIIDLERVIAAVDDLCSWVRT